MAKYRNVYHDMEGNVLRKGQGIKVPTTENDLKAIKRAEAKRARKRAKWHMLAGATVPKSYIPVDDRENSSAIQDSDSTTEQ